MFVLYFYVTGFEAENLDVLSLLQICALFGVLELIAMLSGVVLDRGWITTKASLRAATPF